jgi:hypothetical protein
MEKEIIMKLFDDSFGEIWRYTQQNLTYKMIMLEAFVINQVSKLYVVVQLQIKRKPLQTPYTLRYVEFILPCKRGVLL